MSTSDVVLVATTIFLFFLAIFGEWLKGLVFKPRLQISIDGSPPDCIKIPFVLPGKNGQVLEVAESYFLRLRIANSGNRTAKDVEVRIEQLREELPDEQLAVVQSFLPMNLRWSDIGGSVLAQLAPHGMYRHCDLAHIIDPSQVQRFPGEHKRWPAPLPANGAVLSFDTIVKPASQCYLVPPGTYHIDLAAGAANAKPTRQTIKVILTGRFHSEPTGMFQVGVRFLSS